MRKYADIAGLPALTPQAEHDAEAAKKSRDDFRTVARFRVGGQVRIGPHVVNITTIEPLTGGQVRIVGTFPGRLINGKFKPSDLETV